MTTSLLQCSIFNTTQWGLLWLSKSNISTWPLKYKHTNLLSDSFSFTTAKHGQCGQGTYTDSRILAIIVYSASLGVTVNKSSWTQLLGSGIKSPPSGRLFACLHWLGHEMHQWPGDFIWESIDPVSTVGRIKQHGSGQWNKMQK